MKCKAKSLKKLMVKILIVLLNIMFYKIQSSNYDTSKQKKNWQYVSKEMNKIFT